MEREYDGATVIDSEGNNIGHVERTYVDDGGAVRLIEVKMGALLAKRRLVPVDMASLSDDGLTVPYSKDVIERSHDHSSAGDTIDADMLENVQAYYGQSDNAGIDASPPSLSTRAAGESAAPYEAASRQNPQPDESVEMPMGMPPGNDQSSASEAAADGAKFGEIRDLGDVIEIPIVEEQLVKRLVVKEVLRVRKTQVAEIQNIEGDVRKESVEIDQSGDASVRGSEGNSTV